MMIPVIYSNTTISMTGTGRFPALTRGGEIDPLRPMKRFRTEIKPPEMQSKTESQNMDALGAMKRFRRDVRPPRMSSTYRNPYEQRPMSENIFNQMNRASKNQAISAYTSAGIFSPGGSRINIIGS